MFYNSFIIRCLGVLAPFLCLVRTFRVGLHSAPLSKGIRDRPVASAPRLMSAATSACFLCLQPASSVCSPLPLSAAPLPLSAAFFNLRHPAASVCSRCLCLQLAVATLQLAVAFFNLLSLSPLIIIIFLSRENIL